MNKTISKHRMYKSIIVKFVTIPELTGTLSMNKKCVSSRGLFTLQKGTNFINIINIYEGNEDY